MMRILSDPSVKLLGRSIPLPTPPLTPLSMLFSRLMRHVLSRHPSILRRMGATAGSRFLIQVTDMPFPILLEPSLRRLTVVPRRAKPAHDTEIRGSLKAFLAMLHAEEDGDALFFSGQLEISGDTSSVVALRNALDDAEIDLTEEIASLAGPAGPALRRMSALLERRTGLSLSRRRLGEDPEDHSR
ncbi:SCP2 sterol-binding domain-containing protein [Rhodobacter sp. Har01]|uniref:ubiquinone anaerobic biosynthesis accessory factor UbiT n=1 Tax=Rhodobacter sp. Har01 TaxID=2883999 RepID=UPI001D060192|nr:SCP2 sterol-binding domain-containing protein [Rhodobacter sp. Har01]MCB6176709.1 SCP2 sterol-binding domain-containing protein [Rhodobacter sp. Har01]